MSPKEVAIMKLSTKALLSSLVAATVNAAPTRARLATQKHERRYEKILEKHDRKGELRATVLGINAQQFRHEERRRSLAEIVRQRGFSDERAFYHALIGKIREELHLRGWTSQRIHAFEASRLHRIA